MCILAVLSHRERGDVGVLWHSEVKHEHIVVLRTPKHRLEGAIPVAVEKQSTTRGLCRRGYTFATSLKLGLALPVAVLAP